jgi:hypothetical protein
MKKTFILFAFFALFASFANAQTKASDKKAFDVFFKAFKTAVAKGDKTSVASMTNFPFYDRTGEVMFPGNKLEFKSKAAFLKNYDKIFTAGVKQAIANEKPYTKIKGEDNPGGGGPEFGEFQLDNETTGDDRQAPLYFKKVSGKYKLVGITYNP